MDNVRLIEGDLLARDLRFAILAARFNDLVVDGLVRGALDALRRHGAAEKHIDLVRVPGCYDMPLVARRLAATKRYDAIVAVGCVIRGQTAHFDFVAGECSSGLARVQHDTGLPIGFGVLTTETLEQALDRAGAKAGNKGADAAMAAVELVNLLRRVEG